MITTKNNHSSYIVLTFLIIFLIMSSCTHYVLVETYLNTDEIKFPEKNVTSTNDYRSIVGGAIKNIAIKAPDNCSKRSATSSDPYADSKKDIIRSKCGVEMSIIERELIKNGYNVYSWEMLKSITSSEQKSHSGEKSYLESASDMGIDILFTINSLEEIVAENQDEYINREYYESDDAGTKGNARPLPIYHRNYITRLLKPYDDMLYSGALGATIDVTAIDVKTGKTIWLYKSSSYNLNHSNNQKKYTAAFAGRKSRWHLFMLNNKRSNQQYFSSTDTKSKKRKNVNKLFEKYIYDVINDFIFSFKSGK